MVKYNINMIGDIMKKLDIVIIILVFIIGITIFAVYFDRTNIDAESSQLGIYYNSELIDEAIFLKKDTDLTYHIESTNDMKELTIIKEDHKKNTKKEYTKKVTQKYVIDHTIVITYDSIKITEASCDNKDCMRMHMSHKYTNPILCVNGISIMFQEFKPIVGSPQ